MDGRRWARLAARRENELLRAVLAAPAAVLPAAGPGLGAVASPGVISDPRDLPAGAFAAVVDRTAGDAARLAALVRACRTGGTVAVVARGGESPDATTVTTLLEAAGCDLVRVVPYDLLGASSPWRGRLGPEAAALVAELDAQLASPAVRAAARLLEREVVAALPPAAAARALVVAHRRGTDQAAVREPSPPRGGPAFVRRALALMQDDAVVRFAAFLAAEVQPVLGLAGDFAAWLLDAASADGSGALASGRARAAGRSWYPGLDARRFVEAAAHRMARGVVGTLAAATPGDAALADTFEYPVLQVCNAGLDVCLGGR
jgi:hypothetical protein